MAQDREYWRRQFQQGAAVGRSPTDVMRERTKEELSPSQRTPPPPQETSSPIAPSKPSTPAQQVQRAVSSTPQQRREMIRERVQEKHKPEPVTYHQIKTDIMKQPIHIGKRIRQVVQVTRYQRQGYQVGETQKGYQFYKTQEQMRQEKLTKIRAEYKRQPAPVQFGRAFFTGATQFPETVYHIISSPFTGETRKQFQERLLLRESESWKRVQQKKYKEFAIKDVALSPAMVEVYITAGTMGIAKAAGPVFRGTTRMTARGYRTVSQFVPEESIIAKGLTKTTSTLGKSPIAKRAYQYSIKGGRWGRVLTERTGSRVVKNIEGIGAKTYKKTYTFRERFGTAKKWLPASDDVLRAEKQVTRKMGQGYKWKGMFDKKLVRKTTFTNIEDVSRIGPKTVSEVDLGSRVIKTSAPIAKGKTPTIVHTYVGKRGGETFQTFKGIQPVTPDKKWIVNWKQQLDFLKGGGATQAVAPRPTLKPIQQTLRFKKSISPTSYMFQTGKAIVAPAKTMPLKYSPFIYGGIKLGTTKLKKTYQPITKLERKTKKITIPKVVSKQKQQMGLVSVLETKQTTTTTPAMKQEIIQKQSHTSDIKLKKPLSTKTFETIKPPIRVLPPIPKKRGRGTFAWGGFGVAPKFKFRKFKIKNPLKGGGT